MASRGSLFDTIFVAAAIFMLAVSVIIGYMVISKINDNAQNVSSPLNVAANYTAAGKSAYVTFDYGFILAVFGLFAIAFVGAFMIDTHPVFFVFGLFGLIFILVYAAILSDTYTAIANHTTMQNYSSSFPLIALVMGNFPTIILFMFVILAIVLYARPKGAGVA